MDRPRLGRLYATLQLWCIVNYVAVMLYQMCFPGTRRNLFIYVGCLAYSSIKVGLFFLANAHVRNLEAASDLCFIETSQRHFVNAVVNGALLGKKLRGSLGHSCI